MHMLVNQPVLYKNGSGRYKYLVVNGDRTFFTHEKTSITKSYDEILIGQMIDFPIECLRHDKQPSVWPVYWYPHGYPILADLFLYLYEVEFLYSMMKSSIRLAKAFNVTSL